MTDLLTLRAQIREHESMLRSLRRELRESKALPLPRTIRRVIKRQLRPRKERKTPPAREKRYADALFSLIVRTRDHWTCQNCGISLEQGRMQCAHGFSRIHWWIRHTEANAWCLCNSCHMRFTHHDRAGWDAWLQKRLSFDGYWGLYAEANRTGFTWDGPATIARLEQRAQEMGIPAERVAAVRARNLGKRD
jgi:hypothetical protein